MEPIIGVPPGGADIVKDSTTGDFQADVIDASHEVAVVVDFWAPWCGPCKQIGPALEKAVKGANGKVRLVKINIDENPELAQTFRIQSIPAVYAFAQGKPVDGFTGAVPESQIVAFIARLGGKAGQSPVEQALEHAKAAPDSKDHGAASPLFNQLLHPEAGSPDAHAGLARLGWALGCDSGEYLPEGGTLVAGRPGRNQDRCADAGLIPGFEPVAHRGGRTE